MQKKRLFKIMARTKTGVLKELSKQISQNHDVVIIKEPSKTLTMIKMREPVKSSLFYIGEVMVTEAIVEIAGIKGMAVTMGDDFDKVLYMAIIDAAFNKGVKETASISTKLEQLEKEQIEKEEQENAMYLKTMVNFNTMDSEVSK